MRPLRILSLFLVLLVIPVLPSLGEDAQVIQSPKSVLTIYSYGYGAAPRIAPEMPNRNPRTAALSDVVAAPPLSTSVPLWPRNSGVDARREMVAPTTARAPKTANTISGNSSAQSSLTILPVAPLVMSVGWKPSPDQSVVGYNLYTGAVSHQYTTKQTLGDQTVAQLPLEQGTIYIAVSAYTAEGLESQLSEELTISPVPISPNTSTTSAPFGAGASSH